MQIQQVNNTFNFILESEEHQQGVSNRYGHHKHLVRRTQLRDKIRAFLAPRDSEIPKQPKKENAKEIENVSLNQTFVPFLNERDNVGQIRGQDDIERSMKMKLWKIHPKKNYYDNSDDPYNGKLQDINKETFEERSRKNSTAQIKSSNSTSVMSEQNDLVNDQIYKEKRSTQSQLNLLNLSNTSVEQQQNKRSSQIQDLTQINKPRQRSGSLLRNVANPLLFLNSKRFSQLLDVSITIDQSQISLPPYQDDLSKKNKRINSVYIDTFRTLPSSNDPATSRQMLIENESQQQSLRTLLPNIQIQNQEILKEQQSKLLSKLLPKQFNHDSLDMNLNNQYLTLNSHNYTQRTLLAKKNSKTLSDVRGFKQQLNSSAVGEQDNIYQMSGGIDRDVQQRRQLNNGVKIPKLMLMNNKQSHLDGSNFQDTQRNVKDKIVSQTIAYDRGTYQSVIESNVFENEGTITKRNMMQTQRLKNGNNNKSSDTLICPVNYHFNLNNITHRNYNRSPLQRYQNNTHSNIRVTHLHALDDHSSKMPTLPKQYIVKYNVTPAPHKYSLSAMRQEKSNAKQITKQIAFSQSRVEKCDFFYPYPQKDFEQGFHSQLGYHNYTSMSETPTFTFGKNQGRDQSSYLKDVVGILNTIKEHKEQLKIQRRQAHAIKEYEQEDHIKRNMQNLLPSEQVLQNQNKSYNKKQMDIKIRQNTEMIPTQIKEYKQFRGDVKNLIKDKEFQVKGQLKHSFANVIDKYTTIKDFVRK
eukprot:403350269